MHTILAFISNLHCPSCVSHIQDTLVALPGIIAEPSISLIAQTVKVQFDIGIILHTTIVDALLGDAFEVVHVTVWNETGVQIEDGDISRKPQQSQAVFDTNARHIENCNACQKEPGRLASNASNLEIVTEKLLKNAGSPIIVQIDGGHDEMETDYKASLSIDGMTCGSCVGAVTRGLQELPFTSKVDVDLLNNAGTVEFRGKNNLDSILETLDDLGYSATLVDITNLSSGPEPVSTERIVDVRIEGLHCDQCPVRIIRCVQGISSPTSTGAPFRILSSPSLQDPRMRVKYKPSVSEGVTLRNLITEISAIDSSFTVGVYHPPTPEERSKQVQRRERTHILWRLIFAGIIAIPTFIIGVVYMAIVPATDATRVWFDEADWVGNVARRQWALLIMTTPVMFLGADLFHRRAAKELWALWRPRSKTPFFRRFYRFGSMNMLISVGTLVAYISSLAVLAIDATSKSAVQGARTSETYFDIITFLTFFILIGRYLEAYSKAKTGDTVSMLSQLRPNETLLITDGRQSKIAVDQLEIGDRINIPRGQSPPTDGVVEQDGSYSFDESSLTGESKPVHKVKGDRVFAGTVNVANSVIIRITELGGSSMLDQIIDVVRDGQAKRAPIERLADILTGYFVPVITALAIVTWIIWLSLGLSGRLPQSWLDSSKGGWPFWSLEFAIAVFVVACPCGIGLAAPTALFVGGGLAAKQGILVQGGGQAFQEASKLDTIVFDKTGTLTQGKMKVTGFELLSQELSASTILAISRIMEEASNHPIAQAIALYCESFTDDTRMVEIKECPGRGMIGTFIVGSKPAIEVAIGNEKFLKESYKSQSTKSNGTSSLSENVFLKQYLFQRQSQGDSTAIVAVRIDGAFQPVAVFALSDPLRTEAVEVVNSLKSNGLTVHLCTGDNVNTAHAVASQLNIPVANVRAGVLPQGKAEYIHELQTIGKRRLVAFVGDGLNDTPALSAADVSISLSSGSDIAMNASSFILLNSNLNTIDTLITLSKRVFQRVKINFFWAAIYNITLIPVAAGVFFAIGANEEHGGWRMSPVWAAVAMAGSSVSVVLSSLALRLPPIRWPRSSRKN